MKFSNHEGSRHNTTLKARQSAPIGWSIQTRNATPTKGGESRTVEKSAAHVCPIMAKQTHVSSTKIYRRVSQEERKKVGGACSLARYKG